MNQRNMGSLIAGSALIVLGGLFLVSQFLNVSVWRFLWPLFVMVPGIGMFVAVYSGGKQTSGLAIPASITSMVGLILLFQSITDHWESWAYAWSLIFPTAVGLGMYIYGVRAEDDESKQRGKGMLRTGLVIFFLLGVFFETIFAAGGLLFGRVFWPVAIILLGVYLIFRQRRALPGTKATPRAASGVQVEAIPSVHGEEQVSTSEEEKKGDSA